MVALTLANLKMMSRNRQAVFWALFFPLLLVVVFGLFDVNTVGPGDLLIVDLSDSPVSQQIREELEAISLLTIGDHGNDEAQARSAVASGDLDYLLIIPLGIEDPAMLQAPDRGLPVRLVYGSGNPGRNQLVDGTVRHVVARILAEMTGAPYLGLVESQVVESEEVLVEQVSYFDGVLMGLVGLGIMTNSIISIAVRISTYRNSSILKRLLVTPLPIWKYFVGEVAAHLVLALIQAAVILAVGVFVFGARIHGNPGNLLGIFAIVALGSMVFLNIGFIVSAWSRTPAAASGMGNAIALPMMFFAGTFFSTAALPSVLPYVAQALPLTPMLVAMREVANAGQPLWTTWPQLAILAGWVLATGVAATRVFKFN
ncbi:MAG: ABC transporter permease [Chloroflexi bacterium]|nr:ABC transporter permease [Chloroflexota bacterium]